jgi:DeoR/GlpR family transcriptional regulator of sugar metabolism
VQDGVSGSFEAATTSRALGRQRQQLILSEVRRRGAVRVSELVSLLAVSDMTIRRDLDVLATDGLIAKVHGGATAVGSRSADEPGFEAKSHRQQAEKLAIAQAAAGLIRPGTAVGITAGTTTWQLAYLVASIPDLIVVTNSIQVAEVMHRSQGRNGSVILTGGARTPSDALVGPVAVASIRSLHLDQVFMGVHGMSERAGFTTPNLMEAETNRAFVEAAGRLVVLADHTKWGIRGLSTIAALRDADVLVTDSHLTDDVESIVGSQVGELLITDTSNVRSLETRNA